MPLNENASLSDIIGEINVLRGDLQFIREAIDELRTANPANEQLLAEMRTLAHNVTIQSNAIETRVTVREEKHAELEHIVETIEAITPKDIKLDEGYLDELSKVKIKASIAAQTRFTSLVTGLELAKVPDQYTVTFFDYSDAEQHMLYSDFKYFMLRYMGYCQYIESMF